MEEDLRREIILDNYTNPYHKQEVLDKENYKKINTSNSSCIDNLDIYINIKNNIIKDIYFEGDACAISTSSCSIMIKNLIGKTVKEAINYTNNFYNMVNEKDYDEEILNEAIVYDQIYKQNNRKHCAILPYEGILKILKQYEEENR